jgi:uncharacterized membrane protein
MSAYKKESHMRSLLKGISWRIIATTDTILVVLFVTCLLGDCSFENALKIGAAEFLIKYIVYYFHERVWQVLRNDNVTSRRTLYKSISWRLIATIMTYVISGTILESFDEVALYIAFIELFTKFALYFVHERIWLKIPLGSIRNSVQRIFKK